jgi:hypothetical protein
VRHASHREGHLSVLWHGLSRGLLDVLDPHAKLAGFVPHDPDKAGCLIELSEVHAAPDTQ